MISQSFKEYRYESATPLFTWNLEGHYVFGSFNLIIRKQAYWKKSERAQFYIW